MDSLNKMMKSVRMPFKLNGDPMLYSAYAVFALAALFMLYRGQMATIALAIGVALILYALTGGDMVASLTAGALVGLIAVFYSRRAEGFTTEEDEEEFTTEEDAEESGNEKDEHKDKNKEDKKKEEQKDGFTGDDEEEEFTTEEDTEEGFVGYTAPLGYSSFNGEALEGFANPKPKAKKRRAPDNGSRGEFFQIGKKYTGPKEEDDADFHLDAGTTFLNAYKSLKPDQIAAMTKDTQELMQTQKQLMSTLSTLKPLITDGKEMMNMFQSYFGGGQANAN